MSEIALDTPVWNPLDKLKGVLIGGIISIIILLSIATSNVFSVTVDPSYTGDCSGSSYVIPTDGTFMPDETCTGWEPTGVTLSTYGGSCNLTTPGATYDSLEFNCNPLNINANGIEITRSQINGVVRLNSSTRTGILIEDVTVDGQNANGFSGSQQCFGGNSGDNGGATAADYVIRRAHVVGCEIAFYGRGMTVEDSYTHNLSCTTGGGSFETHRESVLIHSGQVVMTGNNFVDDLRFDSCSGSEGTSAVAVVYVGKNFWGSASDVTFTGNRFESIAEAYYCIYPGKEPGDGDSSTASNIRWDSNYFARGPYNNCGSASGGGPVFGSQDLNIGNSCFDNNVYEDDGTEIVISGGDPC